MAGEVRQTSRGIAFCEFNPQKPDFISQCGDTRGLESLDDTVIQELDNILLVRSYQEFEQRFSPTVYSYFDANSQEACYVLKKPESLPEELITEIPLGRRHPTTAMMFDMIDAKGAQGVKNIDFGYENILSQISPKKVVAGLILLSQSGASQVLDWVILL